MVDNSSTGNEHKGADMRTGKVSSEIIKANGPAWENPTITIDRDALRTIIAYTIGVAQNSFNAKRNTSEIINDIVSTLGSE
jgi:hypothetical protein